MKDLFRRGVRAAREGRVILPCGPSGAGKDHALAFHEKSKRSGDFVHCPLPTLSESLVEAELFGVVRGAATGVEPRAGLLEVAHGGTIFLNEIGDLPLSVQPKLLHFLDRRVYRKVGSSEDRLFDGLVLCATNADLQQKVADGSFRADLFHRLSECVVTLPPLCERVEDIPPLTDLFLEEFAQASERSRHVLHPLARDLLMRCPWNGNIRELRACLRRAVDASTTGMIEVHHLESSSLPKASDPPPPQGFEDETAATQIRLIEDAMLRAGGILRRAADILGITDAKLRRLIVKLGLGHTVLRRHRFPRRPKQQEGEPDFERLPQEDDEPTHDESGPDTDSDPSGSTDSDSGPPRPQNGFW
jgi:transcriptional regulator with GAF, ATPase, and Fis domain